LKTIRKIHANRIRSFSGRVLDWYKDAGRTFPWRTRDVPIYRLVVTEILLQRTRAATVADFYEEFFSRFPSWASLASSSIRDIESVLKPIGMWKQRAPRLYALAVAIVERGGALPKTSEDLLSLPAVGQYVANAALLFQGISPLPLLDAGMARTLERHFGERALADIRYDPYLQALAQRVVAVEDSVATNWAILDLAALVCRLKNPRCGNCPVKTTCLYSLEL